MLLERSLESPLDKEIKTVHLKGNQSWIFIRRTNAETEVTIFGYLMQRANSLEKTLMLGKFEGRRRRGWQKMRWLDGNTDSMDESEQAPGVGDGQGSLVMDRKPGVSKSHIPLSGWTTANLRNKKIFFLNGKFNNFLIEIYTSI